MDFGVTNVAAITIICYLFGMMAKATPAIADKWIPVICGVLGGILGALAMMYMPSFPAEDYFTAVAIGIVSGFAATGINQVYKQQVKGE